MLESILSRFGLTADTLLADPALWLCATLLAYAFGMWVYKKSGYKTICTPLLVAIVLLVVTLEVTGTDYKTYINGGQHINFLLGPQRLPWPFRSTNSVCVWRKCGWRSPADL